MGKPLKVTLVHGTWAREAEWTKPDAPLSMTLRKSFGDIAIETMPWSGRNRFAARDLARCDLAARIDAARDFEHFIIAHSHGGNIARDAVIGREESVAGLICLNTPFFTALSRETPFIFEISVSLIGITCLWAAFVIFTNYDFHWLAALALSGIAVTAIMIIPVEKGRAWGERRNVYLRDRLAAPTLKAVRFLCLTTPEDEAFGWLGFFEGVANLPFLIMSKSGLPIIWGLVLVLLAVGVLPVLAAPWELWRGAASPAPQGWVAWLLCLVLSSFYFLGLLFVASVLLAITVSSTLVAIIYGHWSFMDANMHVRILPTLTPVGASFVDFYEGKASDEGMNHSVLYGDREAIKLIVDWMRLVAGMPDRGERDRKTESGEAAIR